MTSEILSLTAIADWKAKYATDMHSFSVRLCFILKILTTECKSGLEG